MQLIPASLQIACKKGDIEVAKILLEYWRRPTFPESLHYFWHVCHQAWIRGKPFSFCHKFSKFLKKGFLSIRWNTFGYQQGILSLLWSACANPLIALIGHNSYLILSYIKGYVSINKSLRIDTFLDWEGHPRIFSSRHAHSLQTTAMHSLIFTRWGNSILIFSGFWLFLTELARQISWPTQKDLLYWSH